MTPVLTVVVCTYERPALLQGALEHLVAQTAEPGAFEVLVVDNSPSGSGELVAQRFRDGVLVRSVREPQRGLAHARNRGWREARGRFVAYTDDDCRAPESWVERTLEGIADLDPDILGGPYVARFEGTPPPGWYRDSYGSRSFGPVARILEPHEDLSGGNLVVRRSLLEGLGGFDARLGMSGGRMAYGEETELQLRARRLRPSTVVHYDPALWVWHLVRPEKLSLARTVQEAFLRGRSSWQMSQILSGLRPRRRVTVARAFGWQVVRLLARLPHGMFRDRERFPCFRNYVQERVLLELSALGRLSAEWHGLVASDVEQAGEEQPR